jgi:hypothetical protein
MYVRPAGAWRLNEFYSCLAFKRLSVIENAYFCSKNMGLSDRTQRKKYRFLDNGSEDFG